MESVDINRELLLAGLGWVFSLNSKRSVLNRSNCWSDSVIWTSRSTILVLRQSDDMQMLRGGKWLLKIQFRNIQTISIRLWLHHWQKVTFIFFFLTVKSVYLCFSDYSLFSLVAARSPGLFLRRKKWHDLKTLFIRCNISLIVIIITHLTAAWML